MVRFAQLSHLCHAYHPRPVLICECSSVSAMGRHFTTELRTNLDTDLNTDLNTRVLVFSKTTACSASAPVFAETGLNAPTRERRPERIKLT